MAGSEGDGYGEFGGGGSVKWKVKAGESQRPQGKPKDPADTAPITAFEVDGVDKYKGPADPGFFEITVEPPKNGSIHTKMENGRLKVYLRVNPSGGPPGQYQPQITVKWGDKVEAPEDTIREIGRDRFAIS